MIPDGFFFVLAVAVLCYGVGFLRGYARGEIEERSAEKSRRQVKSEPPPAPPMRRPNAPDLHRAHPATIDELIGTRIVSEE